MLRPEAICAQVRAALEHEPRINLHRYPVHLRYEDGVVTLEGLGPKTTLGALAERDVWYVFGVDRVVNRLQVEASTKGHGPCH